VRDAITSFINKMLLNFAFGAGLFLSLAIFYESTKVFYITLHFMEHGIFSFLKIFFANGLAILIYSFIFAVQILLSATIVSYRAKIAVRVDVEDIFIICLTPALIVQFLRLFLTILPESQNLFPQYAIYHVFTADDYYSMIISNSILLLIGGFCGKFFLNQ
jgi:hypothetical protein